MQNNIIFSFGLFILILNACSERQLNIEDYRKMLTNNNVDSIFIACYHLGEFKDTQSISKLIQDLNDTRTTNNIRFKGMSIYQCKIGALQKITGLKFGNPDYIPNDSIINLWQNWWKSNQKKD